LKKINIAIDGYSSCGKSTVAKQLAKKLGYLYVDSGAMYRSVTLFAIEHNFIQNNIVDAQALLNSLDKIDIDFDINLETGVQQTWLNGKMVENDIRDLRVSSQVSEIAKFAEVREKLVAIQQNLAKRKGVVMDGRDIGTVVLPNAELKIFMTASPEVRAERRFLELTKKGEKVTLEAVAENLTHRDFEDTNRAVSPLKKADDARVLDNSNLTHEEQFNLILEWVKETSQLIKA